MTGTIRHLVAYADTDAGGVMYHGRYVELAERSRLLALHQLGWSMERLQQELGVVPVVHKLQANFRRPARLEQWLDVATSIRKCNDVHCVMHTRIALEGHLRATLDAELVALSDRKIVRWPAALQHDLRTAAPDAPSPRPDPAGAD